MIDQAARKKILGLVGLGIRGRNAVVGVQQVRDQARRGKLKLALVASDASQNSLDKVVSLLDARGVKIVGEFSAGELGEIAGRNSVAVIGVSDAGLAHGISSAVPAISGGSA